MSRYNYPFALFGCDHRVEFSDKENERLKYIDEQLMNLNELFNKNLEYSRINRSQGFITQAEITQTLREFAEQEQALNNEAAHIQIIAEERFVRTTLHGETELIFFDIRDKIKRFIDLPVNIIVNKELNPEMFDIPNKDKLFQKYVSKIQYLTARMHLNYCDKYSLTDCTKKINEYIMTEARKRFKIEYEIEPNSDFSIVRYGRIFTELRKPNESMLDPNKRQDSIVNYDFGDISLDFNTDKKLSISGLKMLDFLLLKTSNSDTYKNGSFQIPIEDYMTLCDLSAQRNAKQQILGGLGNLFNLTITLKEEEKKSKVIIGKSRLISSYRVKNGYIFVEATKLFLHVIKRTKFMTLPNQLFRINAVRNPHSYYFLKKIAELKNINSNSTNVDIITIHKLIESCPTLPKYEEIKRSGQINQRIKDPLFRDLDNLEDTISYELITSEKEVISIDKAKDLPFEEFENLRLHINWNAYPDRRKARIEYN